MGRPHGVIIIQKNIKYFCPLMLLVLANSAYRITLNLRIARPDQTVNLWLIKR